MEIRFSEAVNIFVPRKVQKPHSVSPFKDGGERDGERERERREGVRYVCVGEYKRRMIGRERERERWEREGENLHGEWTLFEMKRYEDRRFLLPFISV